MDQGAIGAPAGLATGHVPILDSRRIGRVALLGAAALGYAVILTPILFVCWLSFFANEIVSFPPQGYTLRWFAHIFDQNNFVSGFVTSLQVGIAAMIGGLVLGVPASLVLARRKFPGREALNILVRIEAADGTVGWGEAASAPTMTGDTLDSLVVAVRDHRRMPDARLRRC